MTLGSVDRFKYQKAQITPELSIAFHPRFASYLAHAKISTLSTREFIHELNAAALSSPFHPNKKTAGLTDSPFVRLMRSTLL